MPSCVKGTLIAPIKYQTCFVHSHESQFMTKFSKQPSKLHVIDKVNNTYRYLEDIFLVNNHELSKYTREIYQKELT